MPAALIIQRSLSKSRGFTLLEVVVTMLVLAIGLLGMSGLQQQALKENFDTSQQSQVMWLAQEITERMRANRDGLDVYIAATVNSDLSFCQNIPDLSCVDHVLAGAAHKVPEGTSCSANIMATIDLWEVFCGYTNAGAQSNASDFVLLTGVLITSSPVAGAPASDPTKNVTVNVSWDSQAEMSMTEATGFNQTLSLSVSL